MRWRQTCRQKGHSLRCEDNWVLLNSHVAPPCFFVCENMCHMDNGLITWHVCIYVFLHVCIYVFNMLDTRSLSFFFTDPERWQITKIMHIFEVKFSLHVSDVENIRQKCAIFMKSIISLGWNTCKKYCALRDTPLAILWHSVLTLRSQKDHGWHTQLFLTCIEVCLNHNEHVCTVFLHICMYISMYMYINICTYMYIYVCIRIYINIYIYICIHLHVYIYTYIYAYMGVYKRVCIYICM